MNAIILMKEKPNCCLNCQFFVDNNPRYCSATWDDIFDYDINVNEETNVNCPLIEINDNVAKLIEVAR